MTTPKSPTTEYESQEAEQANRLTLAALLLLEWLYTVDNPMQAEAVTNGRA